MGRNIGAGAPLPLIVSELERAGWGPALAPARYRARQMILRALCDLLPERSAEALITVDAIAQRTGYTREWTSKALHKLHNAGLISWRAGGMSSGVRVPSWIRVHKRRLMDLIEPARVWSAAVSAGRRALDAARTTARTTAGLPMSPPYARRRWPTDRRRRKPAGPSCELGSASSPLTGGTTGPQGAGEALTVDTSADPAVRAAGFAALVRAQIRPGPVKKRMGG